MTEAPPSTALSAMVLQREYLKVLESPAGSAIRKEFLETLSPSSSSPQTSAPTTSHGREEQLERLVVGIVALNAFLQINVTGPVLDAPAFDAPGLSSDQVRKECLKGLETDGVGAYAYIPSVELFSLARYTLLALDPEVLGSSVSLGEGSGSRISLAWVKLRVHVWHYRLLTQPSLGPSSYSKGGRWTDVPSLIDAILENMGAVKSQVIPDDEQDVWASTPASGDEWSREDKAECLVELANYDIMLGRNDKAREGIRRAKEASGFEYVLTGAMGKRTKYQETSASQLVVLARSAAAAEAGSEAKPEALALNDDTLLETISFDKDDKEADQARDSIVPAGLRDLSPDAQPQLSPLDQIILLTEATLKDAFSPIDTLTAAEVMPFAERVLGDKSTNWQVYTQALIVRSRVEVHRSRTVERGVLQMQAVVDQVIVDTSSPARPREREGEKEESKEADVPVIEVTPPGAQAQEEKPTSFLPAPKPTESAPARERLRYINALSTPPKWHLEAELAYGWAGVGALVSALDIFKRLRLWAEVALCLATAAASSADDDSGRGSGGEDKARGILRWRLFNRTGTAPGISVDADDEGVNSEEVGHLKPVEWMGPEREPPPANAARLFCILGDIEEEPAHYKRAWAVSGNRFARAQKSLGEWYLGKKDLTAAHEAYEKAVGANRLNPELWNRLGDIRLRLGEFSSAAEAYRRGIAAASDVIGGEDARTWSNLGSALWSMYCDAAEEAEKKKKAAPEEADKKKAVDGDEEDEEVDVDDEKEKDPEVLLGQALNAYKRGATLARENWRIWDNVLTLGARVLPLPVADMLHALRNIIRIRNTEDALDEAILRLLLHEAVLCKSTGDADGVYQPPRGSHEKAVVEMFETNVVPLITKRSELWELISRERAWRRDFSGAVEASEKAWRAAVGMSGGGGGGLLHSADGPGLDWRADEEAWKVVVKRTDELVSVLENFGPRAEGVGERWRGKARSAVRSVMGKGRDSWEGSEGWKTLEGLMEGLKIAN